MKKVIYNTIKFLYGTFKPRFFMKLYKKWVLFYSAIVTSQRTLIWYSLEPFLVHQSVLL